MNISVVIFMKVFGEAIEAVNFLKKGVKKKIQNVLSLRGCV